MEAGNIRKLYYSISEVCQITSVKRHTLRAWETEFGDLRPDKNKAGNRIYRLSDIKTIFMIKRLVFDEKYTVEGAKQKLRQLKVNHTPHHKLSLDDLKRMDVLLEVKQDLRDLLDSIENQENSEQSA